MQIRQRLRQDTYTGWRTEKFGAHVRSSYTIVSNYEFCEDVTGINAGDNQPFTVSRITREGGLISGIEKSNLTGYIWEAFPCAFWNDSFMTTHIAIPNQPTNGSLAAQVAARTQPFRAETVSWETLSDLGNYGGRAQTKFKEILDRITKAVPRPMWRRMNRVAKFNIMVQFGLTPLLSDINVLLDFQRRVDSRVKEMERLYGARGLRRTLHLWSGSAYDTYHNVTIQSQGVLLKATLSRLTTCKVRGHIRWYGIFPLGKTDERLRQMAVRSVAGTELDPYVIYELLPWSWLVDYFFNLGNIVKAAKNMFTCYHDTVRIMEHRRTRVTSSNHTSNGTSPNVVTCTPMAATKETKLRNPATTTLNAQESILTDSQLSILSSLTVIRTVR